MKTQELKIGNLVYYNGIIAKIDEILSPKPLEDIRFSNKWCLGLFDGAGLITCTINDIKPIEIAEQWLVKFGFDKYDDVIFNDFETYERYVLRNAIDGTSNFEVHLIKSNYGDVLHLEWVYSIDNDERFKPIDSLFIHTLQNAYFMMAGHEINLS